MIISTQVNEDMCQVNIVNNKTQMYSGYGKHVQRYILITTQYAIFKYLRKKTHKQHIDNKRTMIHNTLIKLHNIQILNYIYVILNMNFSCLF